MHSPIRTPYDVDAAALLRRLVFSPGSMQPDSNGYRCPFCGMTFGSMFHAMQPHAHGAHCLWARAAGFLNAHPDVGSQ